MGGTSGLEKLVQSIFDYAGMFPPAALSLESALSESAGFAASLNRPRMLSADLVLGLQEIEKLDSATLASAGFDREVTIAALGTSLSQEELRAGAPRLREELSRLFSLVRERQYSTVPQRIVSYEVKVEGADGSFADRWDDLKRAFEREVPSGTMICLEPDLSVPAWEDRLDLYCSLIADMRSPSTVLKLRGSGPSAIDNGKLARVISRASEARVWIKATAGLHHPLIEERYGNSLGFLNLLVAHYLRRGLGGVAFPVNQIEACLEERDPANFVFSDGVSWRKHALTLSELTRLKFAYPLVIGSCSLKQPDDDLVRLYGKPGVQG